MTGTVTIEQYVTEVTVDEDHVVVVQIDGMGPQGGPGPAGPPGPAGGGYRHEQPIAAITWTVIHNLGRPPAALYVEDSAGTAFDVVPVYIDNNSLTLTFDGAMDGFALVS